jgi:hypothetical protein
MDGREFEGVLWTFRPQLGWIEFAACYPKDNPDVQHAKNRRFRVWDMRSCVTIGERISVNKIGDQDELLRGYRDVVEFTPKAKALPKFRAHMKALGHDTPAIDKEIREGQKRFRIYHKKYEAAKKHWHSRGYEYVSIGRQVNVRQDSHYRMAIVVSPDWVNGRVEIGYLDDNKRAWVDLTHIHNVMTKEEARA